MVRQLKIFLVSNMYPDKNSPSYGIFVKNVEIGLSRQNILFPCKALIKGRSRNLIEKVFKYIKFYFQIIKDGLLCDYDLIYIHYPTHSIFPVCLVKFLRRKKVIANLHGSDVLKVNVVHRILREATRPLFKKISLFIIPSEYFGEIVKEKYIALKNIVYVSPSGGIDNAVFFKKEKALARNKLNIPVDAFVVGYVSRIDKGKGWNVLLNALKLVKDNKINIICAIVGGGRDESRMLRLIDELELNDNVIYYGEQSQSNLPDYYNSFDVFVLPTINEESLGLVGLEALTCGVPIIASDIGGPKGYVEENINGYLFLPGDHQQLCQKIIHYSRLDPMEKARIKKNCILSSRKYERDTVMKNLGNELKNVQ